MRFKLLGPLLAAIAFVAISLSIADAQSRARYIRDANETIRTRHILNAGIGAADLGTTLHVIDVAAVASAGTSTIDPLSVGGKILGIYWAGNQDQFVDNVVLNANGSVTVTLAAAATAINNVRVVVAHGAPRQ